MFRLVSARSLGLFALVVGLASACDPNKADVGDDDDDDDGGGDTDPAAETCADVDIGSELGPVLATGSTVGASDDYEFCGRESSSDYDSGGGWSTGPDVTVSWTAPASGQYTVHTRGSQFDTTLMLLEGDCDVEATRCDDDGGMNLDSLITFEANGGEMYVFVVDGYSQNESGTWKVSVVEGRPDWAYGGDTGDWGWDSGDWGWDSGDWDTGGADTGNTGTGDGEPPAVAMTITTSELELSVAGGGEAWWFGIAETDSAVADPWTGEDCVWGYEMSDGSYLSYCHDAGDTGATLTFGGDPLNLAAGTTAMTPETMAGATFYLESDPAFGGDGTCWVWGDAVAYYSGLGCGEL